MQTQERQTFSATRKTVRLITLFNLFVFLLFVVPPAHHWVDQQFLALRSIHLEEPVGLSLQIWLAMSTLVVTGLLARMIWQRRRSNVPSLLERSLKLETALVVAWWLAVIGACACGFMIGMGG
jgi:hypothetical protein